jgi:thiol-disulfide isomerase/thioredoxin
MHFKKIIIGVFILLITGISSSQEIRDINSTSDMDSLITGFKGKALLINFWATWCPPCKKEMPDLVKLYKNYKDKDFELILISVDDKADRDVELVKQLDLYKIDFTVYFVALKKPEDIMTYIDDNWGGEIPKSYIYNIEGKKVNVLTGSHSYETFENEIKKVLKDEG